MEDASASGHERVSYLSVPGPATAGNAATYLGSLVVQKCGVIVAAGEPERAAVLIGARRFPGVHFVVLGAAGVTSRNVDAVAFATSGVRAAVAGAVRSVLG